MRVGTPADTPRTEKRVLTLRSEPVVLFLLAEWTGLWAGPPKYLIAKPFST